MLEYTIRNNNITKGITWNSVVCCWMLYVTVRWKTDTNADTQTGTQPSQEQWKEEDKNKEKIRNQQYAQSTI